MQNNSFLSIRELRRSQSAIVTRKNELGDTFGKKETLAMCTKMSPKLSICEERLHPHEFYQHLEEDSEYMGKNKPSFLRRHGLLLVLILIIMMATLGTCVAFSYYIAVTAKGTHSVEEKKVEMAPLSQRHTGRSFDSITERRGTFGTSSKPVIEMNFDKSCSDDDSDILKWKHAENVIGFTENLEYDHGYFILPQAGFYEIHVTLSIDVQYINVNDSLGLYVCVSKYKKTENKFNPIRCVRSRVPYYWAGQLDIYISRKFFQQNEVLVTTISTDYNDKKLVKKIIRPDPLESHLHMFYL